jgi:hydrogenase maturation protease
LAKILICGLGNQLKHDDGLGPCVIAELEKQTIPEDVCLRDFGTSGFKCALEIGGYERVVFVDAVQTGKEPGQIYRINLPKEDLLDRPSLSSFAFSLHESDLERVLATAALLDSYPGEVIIIGCEPKETTFGIGLSPEVEKAMKRVIELVLAEVQ